MTKIYYGSPSAHEVEKLEIRLLNEVGITPCYEIFVDGQRLAFVYGGAQGLPQLIVPLKDKQTHE